MWGVTPLGEIRQTQFTMSGTELVLTPIKCPAKPKKQKAFAYTNKIMTDNHPDIHKKLKVLRMGSCQTFVRNVYMGL